MKRIAFFVSEYDRMNGAQRSLLHMVRNLPVKGISPVVLFPGEGKCSIAYANAGVQVIVLPAPSILSEFGQHFLKAGKIAMIWYFFRYLFPFSFRVKEFMTRNNITILHCNTTRSLLVAGIVPFLFRKKLVWHIRGEIAMIPHLLRKLCERMADEIVLVAESLKDQISFQYHYKMSVVYNSVDETSIPELEPTENVFQKYPGVRFATLAAVIPAKGYHHLIDATALANKIVGSKAFTIFAVGESHDEEYQRFLEQKLNEAGITNFVFCGWKDNPFSVYSSVDAVLLATVHQEMIEVAGKKRTVITGEGLPRTILEAMYFEKPVIGTTVAGIPEQVVDGETGYLVPPGRPDKLGQALVKMVRLTDGERASLGKGGKMRVQSIFSTQTMLEKMEQLYEKLTK